MSILFINNGERTCQTFEHQESVCYIFHHYQQQFLRGGIVFEQDPNKIVVFVGTQRFEFDHRRPRTVLGWTPTETGVHFEPPVRLYENLVWINPDRETLVQCSEFESSALNQDTDSDPEVQSLTWVE